MAVGWRALVDSVVVRLGYHLLLHLPVRLAQNVSMKELWMVEQLVGEGCVARDGEPSARKAVAVVVVVMVGQIGEVGSVMLLMFGMSLV